MRNVSVVVPTYNGQRYLSSCLESFLVQTLDCIEIIVVDDGSVDDSLEIAQLYARQYDKVSVFSIENHGVSYARNYGAQMSQGEYLLFVDCDDTVDPNYCKTMYEKALRDDNDLVVCRFDKVLICDGVEKRVLAPTAFSAIDNFAMIDHPEILAAADIGPWNKLVHRTLFEKVRFPEFLGYAEDRVFSTEAYCLAQNIGVVDEALYHHHYEPQGSVTSTFGAERLDWAKAMEHLRAFSDQDKSTRIFSSEIEFIAIEKSMRLCMAALFRDEVPSSLRFKVANTVFSSLESNFPHWKSNSYLITRKEAGSSRRHSSFHACKNGKWVIVSYYDYGKTHYLLLLALSTLVPKRLFSTLCKLDAMLFGNSLHPRTSEVERDA